MAMSLDCWADRREYAGARLALARPGDGGEAQPASSAAAAKAQAAERGMRTRSKWPMGPQGSSSVVSWRCRCFGNFNEKRRKPLCSKRR